jgi:hypothetical protein
LPRPAKLSLLAVGLVGVAGILTVVSGSSSSPAQAAQQPVSAAAYGFAQASGRTGSRLVTPRFRTRTTRPTTTPTTKPTTTPATTPTTAPATTPATAPATGAKRYVGGVSVGDLQPWNTRRSTDFAAMAAAHSSWIRSDLGWKYLEPTPGNWQFPLFDSVVNDAKANGMRYLAILHTVPDWANGGVGDYAPPADLTRLTNYCYQTVKHYLPMGVREYEIGNEINLPHNGALYGGAVYTDKYLKPCVAGIRQATTELGTPATVLFGSLAPTDWTGGSDPITFLTDSYAHGAAGLFDALAWHPYTGSDTPMVSANMNSRPATLAAIMASHGDGAKKIWATEFGQATGGAYPISEQDQGKLVTDGLNTWYSKPFAGPMFWYSARDSGTSSTDREQHFGVLRNDGSKKPSYAVLASMLTR